MIALAVTAFWFGRWQIGLVSLATLGLSYVPVLVASRLEFTLPIPFLAAIAAFVFGSVFGLRC